MSTVVALTLTVRVNNPAKSRLGHETVQFPGVLIAEAGSTLCQSWQRRGRMRWKISIEGSDEITRGQRFEFEIEKSLEDLAAGSLGLSIEEGKAIMASLHRHIVE
jgi:hypothetical protein